MSAKRAALAILALAVVGLGTSAVIGSVSAKLAAQSGYASFCNVNEVVSCDLVLTSEYAHVFGVPVAWWAGLTYALFAAGAVAALRVERASSRRRVATGLFGLAVFAFGYSMYLAVIAFGVLRAICLLCGTLYLVGAGLFVATWLLLSAVRGEGRVAAAEREALRARTRWIVVGAVAAVVVLIGFAGWEASGGRGAFTAEEVAQQHPDFYRWFTALPVKAVEAGGQSKGGPGSVVIVEFSDFECGHCAKAYHNMKRVLPRFGTDVQVVFRHFPLDATCNPAVQGNFHRYACLAATAAECAAAQGRFWEYHDLLFENQTSLDRDNLIAYAERLGLDRASFLSCLESDAPRARIAQDVKEGARLGIDSTPTLFFNGREVHGALDPDKLEHAIRIERSKRPATS